MHSRRRCNMYIELHCINTGNYKLKFTYFVHFIYQLSRFFVCSTLFWRQKSQWTLMVYCRLIRTRMNRFLCRFFVYICTRMPSGHVCTARIQVKICEQQRFCIFDLIFTLGWNLLVLLTTKIFRVRSFLTWVYNYIKNVFRTFLLLNYFLLPTEVESTTEFFLHNMMSVGCRWRTTK